MSLSVTVLESEAKCIDISIYIHNKAKDIPKLAPNLRGQSCLK